MIGEDRKFGLGSKYSRASGWKQKSAVASVLIGGGEGHRQVTDLTSGAYNNPRFVAIGRSQFLSHRWHAGCRYWQLPIVAAKRLDDVDELLKGYFPIIDRRGFSLCGEWLSCRRDLNNTYGLGHAYHFGWASSQRHGSA